MNYIDIDKTKVPYEFEIVLNNETFQFELNCNSVGDFFTVSLMKNNIRIVDDFKLVYNVNLFDNLSYLDVPRIVIKPFDTTGKAQRANYESLNEDVFLYVLDA